MGEKRVKKSSIRFSLMGHQLLHLYNKKNKHTQSINEQHLKKKNTRRNTGALTA